MLLLTVICMGSGLLLAKLFKVLVLVPASILVASVDLCSGQEKGCGFATVALHLAILITSLQIGYLGTVLSPLFFSMLAGQKMRRPAVFGKSAFSRELRPGRRWTTFRPETKPSTQRAMIRKSRRHDQT